MSFSKDYVQVAEKLKKLFSYTQPGAASAKYDDGNKAFGQGKAAMYLQGSFAVPAIRAAAPDAKIASFPYPATNDPARTTLVSGVDVAVAIGRDTKHRPEAEKFVNYLRSKPVTDNYAKAQSAFNPRLDGAPQKDPSLAGLAGYFDQGRIQGYIDHQFPPAIPLTRITQQFVLDGNVKGYLSALDSEWFKVAARTPNRDRS